MVKIIRPFKFVFAHCLYLNHSKNGAKFPSALPIEVLIDLVELSFIFKGTKLILQTGVRSAFIHELVSLQSNLPTLGSILRY